MYENLLMALAQEFVNLQLDNFLGIFFLLELRAAKFDPALVKLCLFGN
jgi:hypothetical protein